MTRVVVDLEATCWDQDKDRQRRESETIEIGAVFTDGAYEPLGTFQTFIRPVRNPTLTDFCTTLTSIRQADVDAAPLFPEALRLFGEAAELTCGKALDRIMFCSWGRYDQTQLERDCTYHKLAYPMGVHRNLKQDFADEMRCKPCGMRRALDRLKIPLAGTHHRGIDDASNIQLIAKTLWGRSLDPRRHRQS